MEIFIDIDLYLLRNFLLIDKVGHSEYITMQAPDLTDEIQFEYVFKTHYKGLYSYAFTFLNDSDLAEEMVQNVFVKLWEKRAHIQIKESLDGYLYRAVKNKCLSHFKHEKVKSEYHAHTIRQHIRAMKVFSGKP